MDALKRSIASEAPAKGRKPRKASSGQKEMLLPIEGEKPILRRSSKTRRRLPCAFRVQSPMPCTVVEPGRMSTHNLYSFR